MNFALENIIWKAQGEANQYVIFNGPNWLASIRLNGEPSTAQQEAVLDLFTAAPEMLNALVQVRASLLNVACNTDELALIDAAIAKAKGDIALRIRGYLEKTAMEEFAEIRKLVGWQHEDETITEAVQRVIRQRDHFQAEVQAAIEYVQQ